ncbi:MAG TPA: 2-oxoglutarate and iron-dependent oxygenase domain-containing protein [Rhodanobacter sp.]|nr:2-oxoglutarate and iron-dependent oxygenase domain-containing protein [Rhodanobacter sp.]
MRQVPTLDIRRYDTDRQAFVDELGAAYREFGFCCISGHGIPAGLIDGAYAAFQQFFALPTATKMKYHIAGGGGARGYTPFKVETARDSQYADLKEFWHIGREIARDSTFASVMPPNLWPAEVPDFRRCGYALYQALDQLGTRVLRALALHIGQPESFFDDKTAFGNSILRPIHYPPIVAERPIAGESGDCRANGPHVRAGAHEDINFITLLVGASAEGLEVLSKGEWLPITTTGDAIVVNIGDMLQRLSNHVYPSTTHRVVNPPNENARKPRYSIPFFLHPNPDVVLDPIESCITADNPRRYDSPITAHEYLLQRLREIKLI